MYNDAASLQIVAGRLDLTSLDREGFAVNAAPDSQTMLPMGDWGGTAR